jgi:proteasome-associated ATPase
MTLWKPLLPKLQVEVLCHAALLRAVCTATGGEKMSDRELLQQAQETIAEQTALLEKLGKSALLYGVIVKDLNTQFLVTSGGDMFTVEKPKFKLHVGNAVALLSETRQVLRQLPQVEAGEVVSVARAENGVFYINNNGMERAVIAAHGIDADKGDKIILDRTGTVAVAVAEKARKAPYVPTIEPVSWDDIGGQDDAKQLMRDVIELPQQQAALFAKYRKKDVSGGILLQGPPGCGKTMLAKAAATALGSTGGFFAVKGPEILDPFVGVTESNIRNLFNSAAEYHVRTGRPGVIFVDECEAILSERGSRHSFMEKTVVPSFLTEMDGLEKKSAVVILATNRHDLLDQAILRDGRISYKVEVARPTATAAREIFNIHLNGIPLAKGEAKAKLIDQAVEHLYNERAKVPHSGALIAGIVDKATYLAIKRDAANNGKVSGVCSQDMAAATELTIRQEMRLAA